MNTVLDVTDLHRRFGKVVANDAVSLQVRPGEVVGLLGHNGAGKTTLVSQVVGLLKPDSGGITVDEIDAVARPAEARRKVAVQTQSQTPMDGLTPKGAIEMVGRLRGLSATDARAAARDLSQILDLGPWFTRRALPEGGGLSGGIRRLTGFAMAVVGRSPLIVLDEPTNDVDAARRRALWDAVRTVADAGSGILLVTHNVGEAERVVDELVILDRGHVVASGSPGEIRGDDALRLELHLLPDRPDPSLPDPAVAAPFPVPVQRRIRAGRRVLLTIPADAAQRAVSWASSLHRSGGLDGYALTPTTLEDAYLALTSPSSPAAALPTGTPS